MCGGVAWSEADANLALGWPSVPRPEVRVRLTENGLECSARYPLDPENSAAIDQQMLKALREALEGDSQFKLVSSGAVVLKASD